MSQSNNDDGLKGMQLIRQVLIAVSVSLFSASIGAHTTIAAVLVPQLRSSASSELTHDLSLSQSAWFASMHALTAMLGSACAGWLVHWLGPRRVLLLQAAPSLAGWCVMSLAADFGQLMAARTLVGCASGVCISASQVYLGEMASPQIRGRIVCVSGVMSACGCLLSYVGGYLLPWRWVCMLPALACVLPGVVAVLCIVPESPHWLVAQKQVIAARRSLYVTRAGHEQLVEGELAIIEQRHGRHLAECHDNTAGSGARLSGRQLVAQLRHVHVLVPLLTVYALFVCRMLAGIIPVLVYAVEIFDDMSSMAGGGSSGHTALNSHQSAIVLGCVRVFTALVSALYVSDRFGRRPLLIMSGVLCCASNMLLASFLTLRHVHDQWTGWPHLSWLPLVNMVVFLLAFDFGFARTGWVIQSELLPTQVRAAFSGSTVCVHFVFSFIGVFTFPYMRARLTLGGTFLVYAVFSFVGFLVSYFLIPETKNQRLEVIEDFYISRFGKKDSRRTEAQTHTTKL